jgi:hypothetical protein
MPAAALPAARNSTDRVVHAAGLLPILGAAQFAAVGLSQLGECGADRLQLCIWSATG